MADSTDRFSDRADVYAKFRPGYPKECIDFLAEQFMLDEETVVADIGSGTGILSALLLKKGCTVIGIEPNADMRHVAEKELSSERFISINATGESTHLADNSVDLVTVAQAFHWMDVVKVKKEFKRILRKENGIALLWNIQSGETGFAKRYEAIKGKYGENYIAIRKSHEPDLTEFFKPHIYTIVKFPHYIILNREGLSGLIQSSSFMPRPNHQLFSAMVEELDILFLEYNENGLVRIDYETHVHFGK